MLPTLPAFHIEPLDFLSKKKRGGFFSADVQAFPPYIWIWSWWAGWGCRGVHFHAGRPSGWAFARLLCLNERQSAKRAFGDNDYLVAEQSSAGELRGPVIHADVTLTRTPCDHISGDALSSVSLWVCISRRVSNRGCSVNTKWLEMRNDSGNS